MTHGIGLMAKGAASGGSKQISATQKSKFITDNRRRRCIIIRLRSSAKRDEGRISMAKRSARSRHQLPGVALLVETARSYGREVLRGVADYARIYGPWLFYIPTEMPITR